MNPVLLIPIVRRKHALETDPLLQIGKPRFRCLPQDESAEAIAFVPDALCRSLIHHREL